MRAKLAISIATLAVPVIAWASEASCPRVIAPPSAVVSVEADDPRVLLQRIVEIAKQRGFIADGGVDWDGGWFIAKKTVSDVENYQVAIWLKWNLYHPGKELDVFLDYAKFHHYKGSGDWDMICPNMNMDTPVNQLREDILHISGLRGPFR
jgi:hypothetical protein